MYYKVNVYLPDNTKSTSVAANLTISGDTVTFTKVGEINFLNIYNETEPYKVTVKGLPVYAFELTQKAYNKLKESEEVANRRQKPKEAEEAVIEDKNPKKQKKQ